MSKENLDSVTNLKGIFRFLMVSNMTERKISIEESEKTGEWGYEYTIIFGGKILKSIISSHEAIPNREGLEDLIRQFIDEWEDSEVKGWW